MLESCSLNRLFVLRHGHSQANEMGMIVSDLQRGQSAFGLTDTGREQVQASVTAAQKSHPLDQETLIISSPFLRTVETAQIAAELLGVNGFTRDQRLRERFFGSFELGKDENYPLVWAQDRHDITHTQWGVESVTAELERLHSLLTDLNAQYQEQTIVLVSHGDIASALLCWAAGQDMRTHRDVGALETAGFAPVVFKRDK